MLLTIIILCAILILSISINVYFAKRSYKMIEKIEEYEDIINKQNVVIDDLSTSITATYLKLKMVDDRGIFASDDDVGFIFSEMLLLIEKLKNKI